MTLWTLKTECDIYRERMPILYWSMDNGTVMLINGDHFPVTAWFDEYGEPTDDGDRMAFVSAGPDSNGKYWNIEAAVFPWVPIQ